MKLAVPCLAWLAISALTVPARADDAAKVKSCESAKKTLATRAKTKPQCQALSDVAQQQACTTAEAPEKVAALMKKCDEPAPAKAAPAPALPAKLADAAAPVDPPAPALARDACRATDEDGVVLAEATAKKAVDCRKQIKDAVTKAKCTDASVKKVKFMYQRGESKPASTTVFCPKTKQ